MGTLRGSDSSHQEQIERGGEGTSGRNKISLIKQRERVIGVGRSLRIVAAKGGEFQGGLREEEHGIVFSI